MPVLAPLIHKEIYYRLLTSENGRNVMAEAYDFRTVGAGDVFVVTVHTGRPSPSTNTTR